MRLSLGEEGLQGWVVDQQDDGLGLRFGGEDAARLLEAAPRWREGALDLQLPGLEAPQERLPVVLVHATQRDPARRECFAGLVYDRRRMKPEQVVRLLALWRRFDASRA